VFPLYPQYSSAATGSSIEKVFRHAAEEWNTPYLKVVPPFYDHPLFLDACARQARPVIDAADPERVIFTFHGLPERHCTKSDESGAHCLKTADCCDRMVEANRNCYRAQCFATARGLADLLRVPEEKRIICFQSRLGRDPWIRPYTDEVIVKLARDGVKRAVVVCPAFVADCLETLEELGIRAVKSFRDNGGESMTVVPAVNSSDAWVDAVVTLSREAWVP
jgi:ferrochelatase